MVPAQPTPFLLLDPDRVRGPYRELRAALPVDALHYAVKTNPHSAILSVLRNDGCQFEIASVAELHALVDVGVNPADVLYSHPVKPAHHIAEAHRLGCWRFCADSVAEIEKLARHAPACAVYIRLRCPNAGGAVRSEGKFGVGPDTAVALLRLAADLSLTPHGLTFHVGSQTTDERAWADAIAATAPVLSQLREHGIRLAMLDIGGGFPVAYTDTRPHVGRVGAHIQRALDGLPYRPRHVVAEPGRALVADAAVLVAGVIGTAVRDGHAWAHTDAGAFHGLIESLESQRTLRYPMTDSRASLARRRFHVTGPSCDSQDTILHDVPLSADLTDGDRIFIALAGAYTTAYTGSFNGFDQPATVLIPATSSAATPHEVLTQV